MSVFRTALRRLFAVWLGLLALLGLTIAAALLPLGSLNPVLALLIACLKAALVMGFFMELHRAAPLLKLITATALAALGILVALSGIDYVTRHTEETPWQKVPAPLAGRGARHELAHS